MKYKCPKCGEQENLHYNYDFSRDDRPVTEVLCNQCGEIFSGKKANVLASIFT